MITITEWAFHINGRRLGIGKTLYYVLDFTILFFFYQVLLYFNKTLSFFAIF